MAANRRINVSALDFDTIKQNLKNFLKDQEQFSDFDFEGSNMSVLLDVLAYNTHYNALYMNMALNEAYLDSATKRNSVVSIARGLGYTPRSASCAKAVVSFEVINTTNEPPFLVVPAKTPFSGNIDGERFSFYTKENLVAPKNAGNSYTFSNITLYEGIPLTYKMTYTTDNRYTIPNPRVDLSTLTVRVQENSASTLYETWTPANLDGTINGESKVYFVKEVDNGFYELSFGDGVLGKALSTGNVVNLDYFISSGTKPNTIRALTYGGPNLSGGTVNNVSVTSPAAGGRLSESIEEIRFNAPNLYAAQNRAVTATDYEAILLSKVPEIDSVVVWGGENNVPPVYGKVFISATTKSGNDLTYEQQQAIKADVINKYKVVSIIPEFTDPNYINIELDLVAYFDTTITTKTAADLQSSIVTKITAMNNDLKKFNKILRTSAVSRLVDSVDPSIVSSAIRMKMYRSMDVNYGKKTNYTMNIGNPLEEGSITCSPFTIADSSLPCYIYDISGNIILYSNDNFGNKVFTNKIGTIDYKNGIITMNSLNITSVKDEQFTIVARPASPDVASIFNQIVKIDTSKLKVTVIVDESTKGRALSGNKFVFTSNKI